MVTKSIGERLFLFRKAKKLTQKQVASDVGTSASYISEIEAGKKLPGSEILSSLLRSFELNINWLLSGQGEMIITGKEVQISTNDQTLDAINRWINDFWQQASPDQKVWFKVQMERCFPEFANTAGGLDEDGTDKSRP